MHSTIGQNIKSLDVSDVRRPTSDVWCLVSGPSVKKIQMVITQQHVIRSTSCLVLGWDF